jgi:hypothetical protein
MTEEALLDFTKSGWFIAIVAATWGIVLRTILGRREAAARRLEDRFVSMEEAIGIMQRDIADISAVLRERGRDGRHTWPSGHE